MNSTLSYHDWYVFFRLLLIYNFTISLISLLNWNISALPNKLQNFFNIQLIGRTEMETMRNSLSWSAIETETDTKFRSIQKSKRNEGKGRKNGLVTRMLELVQISVQTDFVNDPFSKLLSKLNPKTVSFTVQEQTLWKMLIKITLQQ